MNTPRWTKVSTRLRPYDAAAQCVPENPLDRSCQVVAAAPGLVASIPRPPGRVYGRPDYPNQNPCFSKSQVLPCSLSQHGSYELLVNVHTDHDPAPIRGPDAPAEPLVRVPQQERSRRTLERLANAGAALLRAGGSEALTITGVTRRARTSVGSFYARFQGKEDFLRYLGEGALDEAMATWRVARGGLGAGGAVRRRVAAVVSSMAELYLDGPASRLALLDGLDDPPPTRRRRLERFFAGELADLLAIEPPKAEVVARVLTGVLGDPSATGLASPGAGDEAPALTRETLVEELVQLLSAYVDPGLQGPDPFDVWG